MTPRRGLRHVLDAAQPSAGPARPAGGPTRGSLTRFGELVDERRDELAAMLTGETGKPITPGRNELNGLLPRIDFFLDETERVLADESCSPTTSRAARGDQPRAAGGDRQHLGVELPVLRRVNVFVPALLAGNAVLYKPSEHATLDRAGRSAMLHDAGVPVDVFVVVAGAGDVGAELLAQPLDGVFFTGSYATGRRIAEAVAGRMIPVQLELGGKDPVYVPTTSTWRAAAEGLADGAFYNNGQSCCSVERIYVHEARPRRVRRRVRADGRGLRRWAIPTDERDLHRSAHPAAAARRARGPGRRRGGEGRNGAHGRPAPCRSRPGPGSRRRCSPRSTTSMAVMRDESFGPIIGIQRVADDDEAVALMNDTEYGLTAGVYSADEARARRVLGAGRRRIGLLELLRSGEPAPAVVGPGPLGHRLDAVDLGIRAFVRPKAWHLRG